MSTPTIEPRLAAARLFAADTELWRGPSGEYATGEATARHLEAVRDLLDRDGWTRTLNLNGDDDGDAPADTSPFRDKFAWLFRRVRSEYATHYARTLAMACTVISESDHGDHDTLSAARNVIRAILRARTGARYVSISAWAGRLDRTWEQVRDLLTEAADEARAHGPAPAAAPST